MSAILKLSPTMIDKCSGTERATGKMCEKAKRRMCKRML